MSEYAPISDRDAELLVEYLRNNWLPRDAVGQSTTGKQITALQTYGPPALEDRQARWLAGRQLGRELENGSRFRNELLGLHLTGAENTVRGERMAEVEHLAGRPRASQPWNLLSETARITAETRSGSEPSFEPDMRAVHRATTVWHRLKRMAQQGGYEHVRVLEVVFGPIGLAYWESGLQRQQALLCLLPAGRELLDVLPPLPAMAGPREDWDALRVHLQRRQQPGYVEHDVLFARSDAEWQRTYNLAARCWVGARGGA